MRRKSYYHSCVRRFCPVKVVSQCVAASWACSTDGAPLTPLMDSFRRRGGQRRAHSPGPSQRTCFTLALMCIPPIPTSVPRGNEKLQRMGESPLYGRSRSRSSSLTGLDGCVHSPIRSSTFTAIGSWSNGKKDRELGLTKLEFNGSAIRRYQYNCLQIDSCPRKNSFRPASLLTLMRP